jgi:dihydrofolate synthase/folylpolyglutamate synthase
MSPDSTASPAAGTVLARLGGLHPKVIDLSLGRIERLLTALGRPQDALPPVVHVAGTNGKGSTIAFLRAMLEVAGLAVHVYTSPHLVRFNERIVVAGREIDDLHLASLLQECERANEGGPITFFEITTAAALLAFARAPADVTLLENGLGGRLDATNVVARPALTAITPISLDHQSFLGGTIEAIAFEKAGILKPGVACVVAAQHPDAAAVIRGRAAAVDAPLIEEGRDWRVDRDASGGLLFRLEDMALAMPPPGLKGLHQAQNAGAAIACALHLAHILPDPAAGRHGASVPAASAGVPRLDAAAIRRGIETAHWPARLQRLDKGILSALLPEGWELWLDGGHNPGAARALARQMAEWHDRPLHVVFGMLRSKDADGFLEPLARHIDCLAAVSVPGDEGSLSADEAVEIARRHGIDAMAEGDVAQALRRVAGAGGPRGRVLICGSLYLAGAVLALNGNGAAS